MLFFGLMVFLVTTLVAFLLGETVYAGLAFVFGLVVAAALLQRGSKQLTRSTVSAVLKEASCISGSDCIECLAHSLN